MIYDTDLDIKHRDFHNGKLWEKLDIPTMIGISWNRLFFPSTQLESNVPWINVILMQI